MSKHYFRLVRKALRSLRHPHLKDRRWWKAITKPIARRELWIPCRDSVAHGAAIGVFFSMLILMPFQMLAAALVAMRVRANIPISMALCWISNLITMAPLLWLQCEVGNWMRENLGISMPHFLTHDMVHIPEIGHVNSASLILGMLTFAFGGALLAYPIVYVISLMVPHHLPIRRRKTKAEPTINPAKDGTA